MGRFIFGFLCGAAFVLGSLKYHVIRTETGVEFVPKLVSNFGDTYIDSRGFSPADWAKHKQAMAAIVHARKEFILRETADDSLIDGMHDALDNLGLRSAERPSIGRNSRY